MQQLAASPEWFVVGDDGGGNLYVVDLAPGPQGTFGQVLFVNHEMSAGARWLAPSLTELLTERPATLAKLGPEGGLLVRVGSHSGKTLADVQPMTEVLYTPPVTLTPAPATDLHDEPGGASTDPAAQGAPAVRTRLLPPRVCGHGKPQPSACSRRPASSTTGHRPIGWRRRTPTGRCRWSTP